MKNSASIAWGNHFEPGSPTMGQDAIKKALETASQTGYVLVATADEGGLPHVAAAGSAGLDDQGRLLVGEWFCPGTIANIERNRRVAIVAWNPTTDEGHQLLGEVIEVEELAVMDGYAPEVERAEPGPQVERQLVVRVDQTLRFSRAPHADVEE